MIRKLTEASPRSVKTGSTELSEVVYQIADANEKLAKLNAYLAEASMKKSEDRKFMYDLSLGEKQRRMNASKPSPFGVVSSPDPNQQSPI